MRIRTLSVTEVTNYIKRILTNDPILHNISVQGEVSNYKEHSSGHLYFTLKDDVSRIPCVMFLRDSGGLTFSLADGMAIMAKGQLTVYEKEGRYQIIVKEMSPAGQGDLFARFEAMKARLETLGYFKPERKKSLPTYPRRIGVVASGDSAAWRDIQSVVQRRNDSVELFFCHSAVQGVGAAGQLSNALITLDQMQLDVLLLARGGGSIEELWAFNEEGLARTLSNLRTPVITGIGHETDFTIADFVADMRAPTPSAAAEMAVQSKTALQNELSRAMSKLSAALLKRVHFEERMLENASPKRLESSLLRNLTLRGNQSVEQFERSHREMDKALTRLEHRCGLLAHRLDGASPLKTLQRGYAIISTDGGERIKHAASTKAGQHINIMMQDGVIGCVVDKENTEGGK